MNKLVKTIVPLALAMTLIGQTGAVAESAQQLTHTKSAQHTKQAKHVQDGYKQKYLLKLVEKYAPETKNKWEKELTRSTALRKELKKLRGKNASDQHKSWKDENKAKKMEHIKKQKNKYRKFKEAVQSKDEAKIKAALSHLLKDFQDKNERMEKKITELKNA